MLSDTETQKNGWVQIVTTSKNARPDFAYLRGVANMYNRLSRSLPLRTVSRHVFMENNNVGAIISFLLRLVTNETRVRVKVHHGKSSGM